MWLPGQRKEPPFALSGPGNPGKALSGGHARPAFHLHGIEMETLTQARQLVGTGEQARRPTRKLDSPPPPDVSATSMSIARGRERQGR